MIYKVAAGKKDLEIVKSSGQVIKDSTDYNNIIVNKPWGYEYLVFENENVAIWMLHLSRTQKTSTHSHPSKTTALLMMHGEDAKVTTLENSFRITDKDCMMIDKGAFHSTEAISTIPGDPFSQNGIWLLEIESPPNKSDLLRLNDKYGRDGKGYEGSSFMATTPVEHFRLESPEKESKNYIFMKKQLIMVHGYQNLFKLEIDEDAFVFLIKHEHEHENIGVALSYLEAKKAFNGKDFERSEFLVITNKNKQIKLSDFIFNFLEDKGINDIFAISGGGAMHLIDSIGKNPNLNYISAHHEQASAMAAEGYSRIKGLPGVCVVTSGPGGTNTTTGVIGAWIDSIPMIVISGQVTSDTLSRDTGLRQFGIQECDITKYVKDYTKFAITIKDPNEIKYYMQKAYHIATTGRPGPVWLDIPLDVQGQIVNIDEMKDFIPEDRSSNLIEKEIIDNVIRSIQNAKRPVIIYGYGVRLSKTENALLELVESVKIPAVSSWTASDIIPSDHELYVGRSGIMGDRASNFTVQNSDLVVILGSRMSIPQVGYNYKLFAREAKKIMVDIDSVEINKPSLNIDIKITADLRNFFNALLGEIKSGQIKFEENKEWNDRVKNWKIKYPVNLPEYKNEKEYINSFYFVDYLSKKLGNDAIVVTDMGTSFTCTMQTFKTKAGQRFFTSSGHASMGFGLPGAIGACIANHRKKTICISGEGALQMNLQELQTVVTYNLPIILFVLNNQGYLTIKSMQQNHFGRLVGSDPSSFVNCPDMGKIAYAYGIDYKKLHTHDDLHESLDDILATNKPFICEIVMHPFQQLIPRVSSMKLPDGRVVSKPMEDLFPFLDRAEFLANMIVKPVEILNKDKT
jgi:acetolactate synthase-1/2/3 large subunit